MRGCEAVLLVSRGVQTCLLRGLGIHECVVTASADSDSVRTIGIARPLRKKVRGSFPHESHQLFGFLVGTERNRFLTPIVRFLVA